jgi:hypothetical protein
MQRPAPDRGKQSQNLLGRGCPTRRSFAFEDGPDISFSVEDAKNVYAVLLQNVINANGFKSSDRPRAEILESRIVGRVSRADSRVFA